VLAAIRAGLTDDPTIHVQHEYGIYGPKSLWSFLFFPILFVLSRIRGQSVVVTFHSAWNDDTIGPPLMGPKRLYVTVNNQLLAATVDHAIFLSDNASAAFQQSVKLADIEIFPHGVQVDTESLDQGSAKERLGYDPETTLVVQPGYIRQEKGCDAFVKIATHFENVQFLLAGGCQSDKSYCESVREAAPENVRITGQLPDRLFHAAFNAADMVVLPYREVTQSGVFNWCVAYELPVLGSDSEYFRSLRLEWGCTETVDTEDATTAASRLRNLLEDKARREALCEGMAAYRDAASMTSVADRHEKLYRRV
jgi:glycosyltransferase involved in cell wall biosynthesis